MDAHLTPRDTMNETRSRYASGTTMVAKDADHSDTAEVTLRSAAGSIEKGLLQALERVNGLDAILCGPAPQGGADKDCGPSGLIDGLERCVGLVNRLHIGLSNIEQRIG